MLANVMEKSSNTATFSGSHNAGTQIGQNLGSIIIHRHDSAAEVINNPSHNLQFERDPEFFGREDIITQIKEKSCSKNGMHNRIALVGLGGIGKSQIAIEYAYRLRDESPEVWVFWVYANDGVRFKDGYRSIASKVKLPGQDHPDVNILLAVSDWLSEHTPWLLILDNVDDATALRSEARYLPQSPNGTILVTSRYEVAARQLVGASDRIVHIGPMEKESASGLLRTKIGTSVQETHVSELIDLLEGIPLAITHAASYIDSRQISIQEYIQLFHEGNDTHLLSDTDIGDLRRDPEVHHSVILTWEISIQQILRTRPQAADLLSLMSMFDRTRIPKLLLMGDLKQLEFEDTVKVLTDFSMIRRNSEEFDMHRLVQLTIRNWLAGREELPKWRHQAIKSLRYRFIENLDDWQLCETMLPHGRAVTTHEVEGDTDVLAQADICFDMSMYVSARGDYKYAEQLVKASLEPRRRLLGEDHQKTLRDKTQLATAFHDQGLLPEAEQLELQIIEAKKRVLDEEDPDTLVSMHNLATTYLEQGEWEKAEQLEKNVLEIRTRVLGADDPETLYSMSALAAAYSNLGRWKEAEQLNVQVIKTQKRIEGEESNATLSSMNNLATNYLQQERWAEAEQLGTKLVVLRQRVLGEEHPDTLLSMAHLASAYSGQGQQTEAVQIYSHVIKIQKRVLGQEHPDTLWNVSNLASMLETLGQLEHAQELYFAVWRAQERTMGLYHRHTLFSMASIASTLSGQGRLEEAEQLSAQLIAKSAHKFGDEDPDTLDWMLDLAVIYRKQERWEAAKKLEIQVVETRKRVLGNDHPETLTSMYALAQTYKSNGEGEEAVSLLSKIVSERSATLGPDHPRTKEAASKFEQYRTAI